MHLTVLSFTLITFVAALAAGLLGSLLGLGGGIIIIPFLTLLMHVDIKYAIGASIISVIATSSGAASAYVREHMSNLRVGIFLSMATTAGGLTGAYLNGHIDPRWLFIIFSLVLAYSALMMLRDRRDETKPLPADKWADKLRLHDHYYDYHEKREVYYRITRSPLGLFLMYIAGMVSGLLGIGSGALKVPALDLAMRLPFKVSTATSNFMMGITAAASAGIYFAEGGIKPIIAAPVCAGVLCGAVGGSKLLTKIRSKSIRAFFILIIIIISVQMFMKGIRP